MNTTGNENMDDLALIGILTVSDRASRGEYEDRGGPAIREYLERTLTSSWEARPEIVADIQSDIEASIRSLAASGCCLIPVSYTHLTLPTKA